MAYNRHKKMKRIKRTGKMKDSQSDKIKKNMSKAGMKDRKSPA